MTDLHNVAMVASLKTSRFSGKRTDHDLSEVVAKETSGQADAFRVVKSVVPHRFLKPVNTAFNKVSKVFRHYTTPWIHEGTGLLAVSLYTDFMTDMNDARKGVTKAVDDLISAMPAIRTAAKIEMGTAYDADLIPSDEELREMFSVTILVEPIKTGAEFPKALGEVVDSLKENYEGFVKEQMVESSAALFSRVTKVIESLADGLERYGTKEEGSTRIRTFKENVLNNVRDLSRMLDHLNVAGIPELTSITSDIRSKLAPFDVETLKDNEFIREAVAEDARAILDRAKEGEASVRDFFGV